MFTAMDAAAQAQDDAVTRSMWDRDDAGDVETGAVDIVYEAWLEGWHLYRANEKSPGHTVCLIELTGNSHSHWQ